MAVSEIAQWVKTGEDKYEQVLVLLQDGDTMAIATSVHSSLAPSGQAATVIRAPGGTRFKVLFSKIEVSRILEEAPHPTEGSRSAMSLDGDVPTQAQFIRALLGHESSEEANELKAEKAAAQAASKPVKHRMDEDSKAEQMTASPYARRPRDPCRFCEQVNPDHAGRNCPMKRGREPKAASKPVRFQMDEDSDSDDWIWAQGPEEPPSRRPVRADPSEEERFKKFATQMSRSSAVPGKSQGADPSEEESFNEFEKGMSRSSAVPGKSQAAGTHDADDSDAEEAGFKNLLRQATSSGAKLLMTMLALLASREKGGGDELTSVTRAFKTTCCLLRAIYQVSLDGGPWDEASFMVPEDGPLMTPEWAGEAEDMEALVGYR